MTIFGGIAVYFVLWWLCLFAVLPFGVNSQAEAGEITQGTEPGAPVVAGLWLKALVTTGIAAAVFGVIWSIWTIYDL